MSVFKSLKVPHCESIWAAVDNNDAFHEKATAGALIKSR